MSERKPQVLELSPAGELVFKGPFNTVVTSKLTLRNPMNDQVIFKVKTTAPKQYCVRPNSGVIGPHDEAQIAVMLQPFDLSTADKSKHKFMVQTMFAPADFNPEQLDTIWKNAPKSQLMDTRLRCVFAEAPEQESAAQPTTPETGEVKPGQDEGEAYKSTYMSPQQATEEGAEEPLLVESVPPVQPTAGSTPGPNPSASKTEREREQIEANLRMLQDKVDQLSSENNQLKSDANKLRQRLTAQKPGAVTAPLKPGASPASQPSSSPLNLIAILLILVALILGYLVGQYI